jgi:phage-related protein
LGKEVSKTIGSDILTVQCSWPVGKPLVDGLGGGLLRDSQQRTSGRSTKCSSATAASNLVLLHEIVKKARKAPKADVELARKRLREVIAR